MDLLNSFKGGSYEGFADLSKHCQRYPDACTRIRRFLAEYLRILQGCNRKILSLCDAYLKDSDKLSYLDGFMINIIKGMVDFQLSTYENDNTNETLKKLETDYKKMLKKPPYPKLNALENMPVKLKNMSSTLNSNCCNLATEKLMNLLNDGSNDAKIAKAQKQVFGLIDKYNKKVDQIDSEHVDNLRILYNLSLTYIEEISKFLYTFGCGQMNVYKNNINELEVLLTFLKKGPLELFTNYYTDMYNEPLERVNKDSIMERVERAATQHYNVALEKMKKKPIDSSLKNSPNDDNDKQNLSSSKLSKSDEYDHMSINSIGVSPITNNTREHSSSKLDSASVAETESRNSTKHNCFDNTSGTSQDTAINNNSSKKKSKRKDSFAFSDDSNDPDWFNNDSDPNESSDDSIKPIKISFKSKDKNESTTQSKPTVDDNDNELKKIAGEIKLGFNVSPSKTNCNNNTSKNDSNVIVSSPYGINKPIHKTLDSSEIFSPPMVPKSADNITINPSNNTISNDDNSICIKKLSDQPRPSQLNQSFPEYINMNECNEDNSTTIFGSPISLRKSASMINPHSLSKLLKERSAIDPFQNNTSITTIPQSTPLSFAAIDTINFRQDNKSEPQISITGAIAISIDRNSINNIKNLGKMNSIFFNINYHNSNSYRISDLKIIDELLISCEAPFPTDDTLIKNYTINDINLIKYTNDMIVKDSSSRIPFFIHNLLYYKIELSSQIIPITVDFNLTLSPDMRRALVTIKMMVNPTSLWLANSNSHFKLTFVNITMALDDLQQQPNLTLVTTNHHHDFKYTPPIFIQEKNWLIWKINEIPLSPPNESTIVELTAAVSSSQPILMKPNTNNKSTNKLSINFTCDDAQFVPISFSLLPSTDPIYLLNIFKKKINSGSYIFMK